MRSWCGRASLLKEQSQQTMLPQCQLSHMWSLEKCSGVQCCLGGQVRICCHLLHGMSLQRLVFAGCLQWRAGLNAEQQLLASCR